MPSNGESELRQQFLDGSAAEEIDFQKLNGLLPAVVQDASSREVLMVGFMNRQALDLTFRNGYVTFFSRTRNRLWTKGETSGNRLRIISAYIDCDRDTLLLQVAVEGDGVVCHYGTRSCFTKVIPSNSEVGTAESISDAPAEVKR